MGIKVSEMNERSELKEFQEAVGATDEEIAARAGMSKTTLRRAMSGDAPDRTKKSIGEAIEALRRERIERLTKLSVRTAG